MWRTPDGNEVLTGKFKRLFGFGVYSMLEWMFEEKKINDKKILGAIFDEDYNTTGPECDYILHHDSFHVPFCNLTLKDKLSAIAEITKALFDKKEPAPELQQYNESAVYAVFEAIATAVEIEIDFAKTNSESRFAYYCRQLVCDAERETCRYEDDNDYINPACTDMSEWTFVITDALADKILWDRDFLDNDFADNDPEIADVVKNMMGIADDYYAITLPPQTKTDFLLQMQYLRAAIRKFLPP